MSIRPVQKGMCRRSSSMGYIVDLMQPHLIHMDDDILSTGVHIYHLKVGPLVCVLQALCNLLEQGHVHAYLGNNSVISDSYQIFTVYLALLITCTMCISKDWAAQGQGF